MSSDSSERVSREQSDRRASLTRRLFERAQRAVEFASNEALGAATAEGGRQLLSGAPFDPRTGLVVAGAGLAAGLLRYALGPEVSGRAQRLEDGILDDFARLGMPDGQLDTLLDDPEPPGNPGQCSCCSRFSRGYRLRSCGCRAAHRRRDCSPLRGLSRSLHVGRRWFWYRLS